MAGGLRYAGFISYSDADGRLAAWLHRSLEAYRVPDALVGRDGPSGPIGKRLGTFFCSRAEGGAGRDLDAEIRAALDRSDALIVLCSPRSAQREHVNEEIRTFKLLGRGQRIMTAIVEGERHAAADAFIWRKLDGEERAPQHVDANGDISAKRDGDEPIIADFRGGSPKRNGAKLRLIAGLLGVALAELVECERVAQRTRNARFAAAAGAAGIVLGLSAGSLAWLSVNPREAASTQRASEPIRTAFLTDRPVAAPRPAAQPAAPAPRPTTQLTSTSPRPNARSAAPVPRPTAQLAAASLRPNVQPAVVAARPAAPASAQRSEQKPAESPQPPGRREPATQAAIVQASAEIAWPEVENRPQENLLQQLRELGTAQSATVRCQGRSNQDSRDRARTLIAASPEAHQAELIGAFNEGYQAAEERTDACPVQGTAE